MRAPRRIVAVILLVLLAGGVVVATRLPSHQAFPCGPSSPIQKSQLTAQTFDAVTKFMLPENRTPNAITAAPDGSVWFGELAVPGVGHLFQNGTLVEYRWPAARSQASQGVACIDASDTWGIALWDGMVWATDEDNSSLVGLNPTTGSIQTIQVTAGSNPYTLAPGPDGSLWFTELTEPSLVGRVSPSSHAVAYYDLPNGVNSSSDYVYFQNSTLGYVLTIGLIGGPSALYSFDPASSSPAFTLVGGAGPKLGGSGVSQSVAGGPSAPTSVAVGEGGIWLAEHSSSDLAFYDFATGQWSIYPTSSVGYVNLTLPYFDASNGSSIWFNEHYGNRIAQVCCNATALVEYSVTNPPAENMTGIVNALTLAVSQSRVWFTEWTADTVGYVDADYKPAFSVGVVGNATVTLQPGSSAKVNLTVTDAPSTPLTLNYSDSERVSGAPQNLTFSSNLPSSPIEGNQSVSLEVASAAGTPLGQYTVTVTVSDGLISESVYLRIVVVA